MSRIGPVLIARYLVATGRRDVAIAMLTDRSVPCESPGQLYAELDVLDEVDVLGELACDRKVKTDVGPIARALARRRRFDLLRPLLERAPDAVGDAIEGVWRAPAAVDDAVLVRDWIVPYARPPGRASCAELLAVIGDGAMARVIADELTEVAAAAKQPIRSRLLAAIAVIRVALGDHAAADTLLADADRLLREDLGRPDAMARFETGMAIDKARGRGNHLAALVADRSLPWRQPSYEATYSRDDTEVDQLAWGNAVADRIAAGDLPGVLAILEHACRIDDAETQLVLAEIAEGLPRAWIDVDVATQLANAASTNGDPQEQDGQVAVIAALAEAGHVAAARALLPLLAPEYVSPNAYARIGAHMVPVDRTEALALIDQALSGDGAELQLAQFVDAELRARR